MNEADERPRTGANRNYLPFVTKTTPFVIPFCRKGSFRLVFGLLWKR